MAGRRTRQGRMQERDALEVEGCMLGSSLGRQDYGVGALGKERLQEWKGQARTEDDSGREVTVWSQEAGFSKRGWG